jgi:hypothetical protein
LNEVIHESQRLEKKNRQLKEELCMLQDKLQASNEPSHVNSSLKKSRTPLGIGRQFDQASSRLPAHSGLMRVMQGYNKSVKMSPSRSPGLPRSSHHPHERNKSGYSDGNHSSESSWSSDEDIFRDEPESDHPSGSESTKRRKREKRRCH